MVPRVAAAPLDRGELMTLASHLFSAAERAAIDKTIESAEQSTRGEIVAVVASASGRYDRAEDLFGLLLALLGLVALWCLQPCLAGFTGADWETDAVSPLLLLAQMVTVFVLFGIGAWAAARWPLLRAPFASDVEMQKEVERRALEVFQQQRLRATTGATGVLIYVSLFEHKVRVVGDDAISAKLQAADWQAVCGRVIVGMKAGTPAQGLQAAIVLAGELLSRHFPRAADDRNELPNRLVLID